MNFVPLLFIVVGIGAIVAGIAGLLTGEVYFYGRDSAVRTIHRSSAIVPYCLVVAFYTFGGLVTVLYGLQQLRARHRDQ